MDLAKYAGAVIKNLREENGWTQTDLAKKVGVGKTTIANYESGTRSPNQDMLFKLADVLQVSVNRLFPVPDGVIPVTSSRKIPVLGEIACGEPILADENIEEYVETPVNSLPTGTIFYLKAKGDSMKPTIPNGSLVLIRQQPVVEDGEIAAVLLEDSNEATLKRVKHASNTILLMPDNRDYDPIVVTETSKARILGKAVKMTVDF
ncbi:LexA family protein [Limosilactobacillus fermentum]|uniref:LexA family protein n=1 Tax=Limosilactobacillus fermentum TaxID=1613 RepID=UPI0013624B11|nr:S24 family peptidase [Limosilactobacillus fermentum]MCZ2326524.1 helix-turn-helix domain-containing protein [Limosilactobacillus fermentum]